MFWSSLPCASLFSWSNRDSINWAECPLPRTQVYIPRILARTDSDTYWSLPWLELRKFLDGDFLYCYLGCTLRPKTVLVSITPRRYSWFLSDYGVEDRLNITLAHFLPVVCNFFVEYCGILCHARCQRNFSSFPIHSWGGVSLQSSFVTQLLLPSWTGAESVT